MTADKPIVYLYPTEDQEVNVKLGYSNRLTTIYPEYQDGWHVKAKPNGDLIDLNTGNQLYALYWEGQSDAYTNEIKEGFVIKGEDTAEFLEEKLTLLGLNFKEREEFIIYWLPKLEHNQYNYVRFASEEEIEQEMPLTVSPQPDTIIRIRMLFKGLTEFQEVPEQYLPATPNRIGFTVVDWGGVELK